MIVGVYSLELYLPGAHSLKDKRQVLRRLKDRMRARHNVSVAETSDYQELWQRAGITVAAVADGRDALERLFEAVYKLAVSEVPGDVMEGGADYLETGESGAAMDGDWS